MKKYSEQIAIIGHFGGTGNFNDGQTVKTRTLYNELKGATKKEIVKIDTYEKKHHPFKLILKTFYTLITTKTIFLLVSENGMKFFFPLLYISSKIFKNRIYHDVIGGRLGYFVDKNPKFKRYLNSFEINGVETDKLAQELRDRGIVNVEVLPNFRRVPVLSLDDLVLPSSPPFSFCTFSRVTKEKGILDAIDAIESFNNKHSHQKCSLDIYGPISHDFKAEFEQKLTNSSNMIRYMGEVDTNQSIATIKNYYGLLFPTFWKGEGSAGTILESFFAGVPVIASDWNCNDEMITNCYNGLLYPSEYAETLLDGIEWLVDKKESMEELKRNCIQTSKYYLPEQHIARLVDFMEVK